MDTNNQAAKPDVVQQFIDAIAGDDLAALQRLVPVHGTEIRLGFRRIEKNAEDSVTLDLDGTPLNMAATLQREALAVYLVEMGAVPDQATFTSDDGHCWACHTVTPIEQATSFRMVKLTQALMNSASLTDWTCPGRRDLQDWPSSRALPGIFFGLLDNQDVMAFFGSVGVFRGLVDGVRVDILKDAGGFALQLNGAPCGRYPTMANSLQAVRDLLLVTAPPPDNGVLPLENEGEDQE